MPGDSRSIRPQDAANAVLQSARAVFASRGYGSTTLSSVAAAAGVAPQVVRSLYGNKERLFAAALRLPFEPSAAVPEMIAPGLDGMGERLTRMTLQLMADERVRADLTSLMRSETAAAIADVGSPLTELRLLSDYLQRTVVDRVVSAVGMSDSRMRVSLITAQLVGVATTRYVMRLEPLASATDDEVVALVAPGIQALLDPTRPLGQAHA